MSDWRDRWDEPPNPIPPAHSAAIVIVCLLGMVVLALLRGGCAMVGR